MFRHPEHYAWRLCVALLLLLPSRSPLYAQRLGAPVAPPSYYREILPIFRTACTGCHNSDNPVSGLSLASYAELMKGGKNGASIVPGKSAESRLVKMLLGMVQPKMPPGGSLKQADIDRVRRWIDAGAKVDSPPPDSKERRAASKPAVSPPSAPRAYPRINAPTPVTALAFGPDNKTLAVGVYQEVQFWDVEMQRVTGRWRGHPDAVRALIYSRDGKWLAAGGGLSGDSGEVRIWDVVGGKEVRALGGHGDVVHALAFSPDGTKLASASADKTVRLWELATGKELATLREHSDSVWGVAWSLDGKFVVSSSADKSVKVWDAATGKRVYSLGAHEEAIYDVEFSPDGKNLLTAGADRVAKIWNFGPEGSGHARTLGGHANAVYAATYASDGKLIATASADKTVKVWEPNGNNRRTLSEPTDWVYCARFSPDGKRLAAGTWDGIVYLWNIADGKLLARLNTNL